MPIRRRGAVFAALTTLVSGIVGSGLVVTGPAAAADDDLSVAITALSPSSLGRDSTVTLQGTVTNAGDEAWSTVQAYLTIRPQPLASREALTDALDADGFAGSRIVDAGRFAELGDVAPGATVPFRLDVPADDLPISSEDGVYPVGVQILATSPDGDRSSTAAARATTLLPRMVGDHPAAPTTLVWSFLLPSGRAADGSLLDPAGLLADVGPEGRLRRLLDATLASDPSGRGAFVDPALIDAVDDLAEGRGADEVSEEDRATAATFRDDLIELAAAPSSWILDYDRTDVLAIASDASTQTTLFGAIERATDSIIARHGLSGARVTWPSRDSVNETLTKALRERGDDPVVVSSSQLADWSPGDGVLLRRTTSRGDLPVLVNDEVTRGLPGPISWVTVRQQTLASAAFASLAGDDARAALVIVDPALDPGASTDLGLGQPYLAPRSLDQVRPAGRITGRLATSPDVKPIGRNQLAQVVAAARAADLLSAAATDSAAFDEEQARALASVLGLRWRADRAEGLAQSRAVAARFAEDLASITVQAPDTVTLSSSKGGFPLTISNGSDEDMTVGVQLDSSNPALSFDPQTDIEIGAGERQTVNVEVDLEEQNATTLTATLLTPDGRAFGTSDEFIVKSSRVGAYLWATMGAAGVFVLLAMVRRFRHHRGRGVSEPFDDDE